MSGGPEEGRRRIIRKWGKAKDVNPGGGSVYRLQGTAENHGGARQGLRKKRSSNYQEGKRGGISRNEKTQAKAERGCWHSSRGRKARLEAGAIRAFKEKKKAGRSHGHWETWVKRLNGRRKVKTARKNKHSDGGMRDCFKGNPNTDEK